MESEGNCVLVHGFTYRALQFWGAIRRLKSVCVVVDGASQLHAKQKRSYASHHLRDGQGGLNMFREFRARLGQKSEGSRTGPVPTRREFLGR